MKSEGYLIIALDDQRYVDLAVNLALSIQRVDTRPVSVVLNAPLEVPPPARALFDQVVVATNDPNIRGAMNKVRMDKLTPYDRTMYIDADCLMINAKAAFFWMKYRGHGFAVEGHRQSTGPVFACSLGEKDAATLCKLLNVPFLSVFNAGVIYFERSPEGQAVFDKARELYAGPLREQLTYRYKHAGEYADEPIFGAAMAQLNILPFEPALTNRLQVTTPNLVDGVIDLTVGELQIVKQVAGGAPQIWAGAICHFCGLAPMETYFDLADSLRTPHGLPPMNRALFQPVVLTGSHHRETLNH